jgi:hypothetical protein
VIIPIRASWAHQRGLLTEADPLDLREDDPLVGKLQDLIRKKLIDISSLTHTYIFILFPLQVLLDTPDKPDRFRNRFHKKSSTRTNPRHRPHHDKPSTRQPI